MLTLAISGLEVKHDQVGVGLRQQCGERHLRRQHGPPYLAVGRQPHHRMRWPFAPPSIRNFAECKS